MWSAVLAWRIEFEDSALKELAKLDKPVARRILAFLRERVALLDDPRSIGEALKGSEEVAQAHAVTEATRAELAKAQAKAEAQADAQAEQRKAAAAEALRSAERMAKAQTEREEAREEAARLAGKLEAMQAQIADLMQALAERQAAAPAQPAAKTAKRT